MRLRGAVLPVGAALLIGPLVVILALRLPLINQLDYADAWFYSAYAWVPRHEFAQFGINYFSVRFPAIAPIGLFERLFGAQDGYAVLRYLLVVAGGGCLYLCLRRFSTAAVALAGMLLLWLNPFFSRMILWDYAAYISVACGVAGFALWWWADDRRPLWTLAAAVLLTAAVLGDTAAATIVAALGVVEFVAALRSRDGGRRTLLIRLGVCVIGAASVFLVGYLTYLTVLPSLAPYDLLRPTIDFLRHNSAQAGLYVHPAGQWLFHEPRIWAPVILSVALIAVLGRRVLGIDVPARIAQTCIASTAVLWLYRFSVTSSVIETWWAYSLIVMAMAPATGVLLHTLAERDNQRVRYAVTAVAATGLSALVIRWLPGIAANVYAPLSRHAWAVGCMLAVALATAMLLRAARGRSAAALVAILAVLVSFMEYAPSILDGRGGTGVFAASGQLEWDGYSAAHEFISMIRDHNRRGREVLLWYPGTLGLVNIAWTYLPQSGQTLQVLGVSESLRRVTPLGAARLQDPQAHFVLVMSPDPRDLGYARQALADAGFGNAVERQGRFAGGRLPYELLQVTGKPKA